MSFFKNIAIRATLWTLMGYGGTQALRLGSNLILTRLLIPELFGLMALVSTFIQGLVLFSDVGLNLSLIRSPRGDDPIFVNTVWTLQIIRGVCLWVGCCVIAWPVSKFYGEEQLLWLLPVVGLTTIMTGVSSTALATLNRRMEIGKLTRFRFGIQVLSLSVMIVWAYFQKTVWALVAGNLVSGIVNMIFSHYLDPKISNRLAWDKEAIKEIASFGGWIFLSTAMTFLAMQSDRLILGKLFTLEMFGVYTIAVTFAFIPRQLLDGIVGNVMLPLVSRNIHLSRQELLNKILKKRWLILLGNAVIVSFFVCCGDFIILTLYDVRYKEAAWMLPIIGLGLWPMILSLSIDRALVAIGQPRYEAIGNSLKIFYMFILMPLGFYVGSYLGVIIVIAFNDVLPYFSINYGLWREQLSGFKQDIQATLVLFAIIILGLTTRYLMGFGLPI